MHLAEIEPSARAVELAGEEGDPRQVEVILRESAEIVRSRPPLVIARTRHGFVCASAGVDASNAKGPETVVLLPVDPDASARALRERLGELTGVAPGVDRQRLVRPCVAAGDDRRRARRRRARPAPRPARDARQPSATSCARR